MYATQSKAWTLCHPGLLCTVQTWEVVRVQCSPSGSPGISDTVVSFSRRNSCAAWLATACQTDLYPPHWKTLSIYHSILFVAASAQLHLHYKANVKRRPHAFFSTQLTRPISASREVLWWNGCQPGAEGACKNIFLYPQVDYQF